MIMVLKGIMTIELTDEATGDVETVTEENMITCLLYTSDAADDSRV